MAVRSAIFDAIPDWVEFVILFPLLVLIARAGAKQRRRLTALQADASQTEDERAKAQKMLTRQKFAAPIFSVMMLILVGSYIYPFVT
jgi:hypothetical protein